MPIQLSGLRRSARLGVLSFALCTIGTRSAVADDVMHYVRVTSQMVLRDRSIVPAGGEYPIKYDAGAGWIPAFETTFPYLPKTAGSLVDAVVFDPPIDGSINKLTATYDRVDYFNSIASHIIPNSRGLILHQGEAIKITNREGQFYVIETKNIPRAYVPVNLVNAAPEAVALGRIATVPPVPPHDPKSEGQTVEGHVFGKLKVAFTLDGKPLPEGSYLDISYDAGDRWVIGGLVRQEPVYIPKDAVELVPHVVYYVPLTGRINSPTQVYNFLPNVIQDPSTLEQTPIFANLSPTVRVGEEVYINRREGNDYVVELPNHGANDSGRIPIKNIDIIAGDPDAGRTVIVAPKPQSENPNAPGYVAPPPDRNASQGELWAFCQVFAIVSVLVGIAGASMRATTNRSNLKPGEPDYGVPHTNFRTVHDGFEVRFSKSSEAFYKATHAWKNIKHEGPPIAAIGFIVLYIFLIFFIILWYGIEGMFKTVIVVGRDSVKINGKTLSRGDFGHFTVHHSLTADGDQVAVLGYTFGARRFPFGGVWDHGHAQEVGNALNRHLRGTPQIGDEDRPSPEALRMARPTDF